MSQFRSALITGASSGIGRELALQVAAKGTRVVVAARREAELHTLVDEIAAAGGRADVCVLDVGETDAVCDAIERWEAETGGLDLVVANAGMGVIRPAYKLRWKRDIEPVLRVNVMGAFATIMSAMPPMVERGRGTLVGVSSLAGMRGLPTSGAYGASKAALAHFLETLRIDLASTGVTVVDVRPGFVDTEMTRGNKFKMPFLMDADEAAQVTLRGIERRKAIITFPWPVASATTLAELMPDALYRAVATLGSPGRKRRR